MRKILFIILFALSLGISTPARAGTLWFQFLDLIITPLPVEDSDSFAKLTVSFLQQKVSTMMAMHENFASYLSVEGMVSAGKEAAELMGAKEETVTALMSLWTSARDLTGAMKKGIVEPIQDMGRTVNALNSRVQGTISRFRRIGLGGGSGGGSGGGTPNLDTAVKYVDMAEANKDDIMRKVETNVVVSLDTTTAGTVYEYTKEDYFKQQTAIALLARSMETRSRLNELTELLAELNNIQDNELLLPDLGGDKSSSSESKGESSEKKKESNPGVTRDISVNAQLYDIWDKLLALQQLIMSQRLQLEAAQSLKQHSETPIAFAADQLSGVEDVQTASSPKESKKGEK